MSLRSAQNSLFCTFSSHTFMHTRAGSAAAGRNPSESRQHMISVLKESYAIGHKLTLRQPGATVPSRFGHSHSVFYVTKGMEHSCPPEMPFSYSQQITSVPLMCQMWEFTFSQCHAAEVQHWCSVEGSGTSGPMKQAARCWLKSLVLCSLSYRGRLLK